MARCDRNALEQQTGVLQAHGAAIIVVVAGVVVRAYGINHAEFGDADGAQLTANDLLNGFHDRGHCSVSSGIAANSTVVMKPYSLVMWWTTRRTWNVPSKPANGTSRKWMASPSFT